MNFDSIYRLLEETEIFGVQQAPARAPPGHACDSCWPPRGPRPHAAPHGPARSRGAGEWDVREELRLRELDEARARAAQMEKTMRWWSDCTANWRDKWSKVRAERDSAREEGRQLRMRLEMAAKELSARKKQQSPPHPRRAPQAGVAQDPKHAGVAERACAQRDALQTGSGTCESTRECLAERGFPAQEEANSTEEGLILDPLRLNEEMRLHLDCPDLFKNGGPQDHVVEAGLGRVGSPPLEKEAPEISALQVQLNEVQKILRQEREMRSSLEKEIERLESAVSSWKRKYLELKESMAQTRKAVRRPRT